MKKCSANCIPCCDFCVHCLHAYAADGGGRCEPLGCMLHRDYEHQSIVEACGECDDFQCFRVPPTNADRIRSMSDEELARWLVDATVCERVCHEDEYCHGNECVKRVTGWLQSPAETEGTE